MSVGKRWTVHDAYGNTIYLTHERWEHITEPFNHPEMSDYEEHLEETISRGSLQAVCPKFQKLVQCIALGKFYKVKPSTPSFS